MVEQEDLKRYPLAALALLIRVYYMMVLLLLMRKRVKLTLANSHRLSSKVFSSIRQIRNNCPCRPGHTLRPPCSLFFPARSIQLIFPRINGRWVSNRDLLVYGMRLRAFIFLLAAPWSPAQILKPQSPGEITPIPSITVCSPRSFAGQTQTCVHFWVNSILLRDSMTAHNCR